MYTLLICKALNAHVLPVRVGRLEKYDITRNHELKKYRKL
jgi:hypothetical protein